MQTKRHRSAENHRRLHDACRHITHAACMVMFVAVVAMQADDRSIQSDELCTSELDREMLALHNALRAEVKLPPLRWSHILAKHSQNWANILLADNRCAHNPESPYGENILATGIGSTPVKAFNQWASELSDYLYRTNSCRGTCGHYTQIVWRDTVKVGCAVARGERSEIWVCSYDPPGNFRNEWPY